MCSPHPKPRIPTSPPLLLGEGKRKFKKLIKNQKQKIARNDKKGKCLWRKTCLIVSVLTKSWNPVFIRINTDDINKGVNDAFFGWGTGFWEEMKEVNSVTCCKNCPWKTMQASRITWDWTETSFVRCWSLWPLSSWSRTPIWGVQWLHKSA